MSTTVHDGYYKVTARHDYTDSVWDVWIAKWNGFEGDWYAPSHVRLKVDSRYEAVVEAIVWLDNVSHARAMQIASKERANVYG